jgi:hypothetical protein
LFRKVIEEFAILIRIILFRTDSFAFSPLPGGETSNSSVRRVVDYIEPEGQSRLQEVGF